MNAARTIIALLFLLGFQSSGEPVRVGILRLDSTATSPNESSPTDAERKRLRDLANTLKRSDFDLILLPEVKNRQTCNLLVNFLKPTIYQVAICSNFRSTDDNAPARQVAILSKIAPLAAWAEEWRGPGQVDLAGGFAFAAFRNGTNTVGFFALRLREGAEALTATARSALVSRQHEAAGRYVMHHVNWVESRVTNGIAGFAIAGDCVGANAFSEGGFRDALDTLVTRQKEQCDALLIRNTTSGSTEISARRGSGYSLIKAELDVQAPAFFGKGWKSLPASGLISRAQAYLLAYKEELSWAAGIVLGSVFVAAGLWGLRRRQRRASTPIAPGPQSTFVVEIGPSKGTRRSVAVESGTTATGSIPPGRQDAQVERWQKRALAAEERARQAALEARAGLMPLFTEVLKQRLFTWLTAQRTQLLTSHEIGTQQVIELEQRLTQLHGQFEERMRTSQQRVAELEREITAKERTIRDLLRAQVRVANQSTQRTTSDAV